MSLHMGKADTHLHTSYSGFTKYGLLKFPESVISPETHVDNARRLGYDVIAITDHNEVEGGFIAQKYARKLNDIEVIVGDEVMTKDGEVIGLGLTEYIKPMMSVEETVDVIREQGALAIAPHPFSFHVRGLQEKIFDVKLDAIETINGGHPDAYSNWFAKRVFDAFPGKWASTSSSDAHSLYTFGFNWTEFEGNTADDFIKAVKNKTTVPKGKPATVFSEVQWNYDVVIGGERLLTKTLLQKPVNMADNNALKVKALSLNNMKRLGGILGGLMYMCPPIPWIATIASCTWLHRGAKKMISKADERLNSIIDMVEKKSGNHRNE